MRCTYTESVIHREPDPRTNTKKTCALVLAVVFLALSVLADSIFLLGVLICGIAFWNAYQNAEVDYEYVHTNDIFDIDKVIRNSSRRQILSIKLDQVSAVAPANSAAAQRWANLKEEDFSDGISENSQYIMICSVNGKQRKLLLQLEPEMLHSLKQWIPEKMQTT